MPTDNTHSTPGPAVAAPIVVQASFRQIWQIPAFVAGLLALVGVWGTRPLWYDPDAWQFQRDLIAARRLTDDRHGSAQTAVLHATNALTHLDRFPKRAGEVHFLLGSAYLRLADQVPADQAAVIRREARSHLEQAQAAGVPDPDRVRLMFRLGKVWCQTDGDLGQAVSYLAQSIEEGADDRFEAYGILSQAYVRLNNVPAALLANERQLQYPTEDDNLLAAPRLLRGELLLRSPAPENREQARKFLSRIGPEASAPIVARARRLLAPAWQEDGAWAQAAPLWEAILADQRETPADAGRIWYWLGCCYSNLGRAADAVRAWEQAKLSGGEEAQAAALRVAEAQFAAHNNVAGLELFEKALAKISKPADYQNALLGPAQAQAILQSSCQAAIKNGNYESARELANLYGRLASPGPAQNLIGAVAEAWANADRERARQAKQADTAAREEQAARRHFSEAGLAYEAVARAAIDKNEKANQLWRAATAHIQAQDFARTITVLEQFVNGQLPERLGEAWYRLGEAHKALGHDRAADLSFHRCIEHPGPFAFRARYQLAVLKRSQEDGKGIPEAIEMLQHNLTLMRTEPDREAHEKTLYELADLLFRTGNFRLAAAGWEQALTIYPANLNALEARYRLGDCYRQLAYENQIQPASTSLPFRKHFVQLSEQAAANYQKVADDLEAHRALRALNETEMALLWSALYALADVRYGLGEYPDSWRLYDSLASRYQQQYEGLVALKSLWNCALNPPEKGYLERARDVLERTRITLNRLPDSIFRDRPESETRPAWEKWIKDREEDLKNLQPPQGSATADQE